MFEMLGKATDDPTVFNSPMNLDLVFINWTVSNVSAEHSGSVSI